jgi:hypothetical protein
VARREPSEYEALGTRAIVELLRQQHAASWLEVEARIADEEWPGLGTPVNPHHLSAARTLLARRGTVRDLAATSRGGRSVSVIALSENASTTVVDRAAARKRLLLARYLGWAQGTPSRPGIIGPAAERVTHASLLAAAPHGYRLVNPTGGGVAEFLGVRLNGPLDNAAFLTPLDQRGLPLPTVAVPVEVKNVRDWLYPSSQEPYQLLAKATKLQQAQPSQRIIPTLVCRRAHITLYRMAKDLGFFIVEPRRQFISPTIDTDHLREVRSELGFMDLIATVDADKHIVDRLTRTLPTYANDRWERWLRTALSRTSVAFGEIASDEISRRRQRTVDAMREIAKQDGLVDGGGW